MNGSIFIVCKCIIIVCSQTNGGLDSTDKNCQQESTSGRDYFGETNTTVDGIACQKWSDTQPHDHKFTHVGDHNFCRNPSGDSQSQVWCYTVDPGHERQNCSVPFCSILKALEMSLDSNSNSNLKLVLDYPGCTTNLNIFSTSLSAGKVFGGGTVDSFHESHMDRCA